MAPFALARRIGTNGSFLSLRMPDMSDTTEDDNQEELEWLLFELDEAREDQRVSLDHIVQVLVACIAALAILYSVAAGFGASENSIPWKNEGIATIAACVILVAGFYGSSIGQERMFRYHYMEMIEKRISEIVPTGDENIALGWNQFSSRLITANIHHLTNRGARRHYVHFALALVSLVIGCVLLSLLLLLTVHNKWVRLLLPLVVMSALIYLLYCYFIATDYSRLTFEEILKLNVDSVPKEYRENSDEVSEDNRPGHYFSQFRGKFLRLLYTRPRDSMKSFFYLGGALLGTSLGGGYSLGEWFFRFFLLVFVVDICGYQARYLINDIRGIAEDRTNPQSEGRNRLPLLGGGNERHTIIVAMLVVAAKAIAAFLVCATIWADGATLHGEPDLGDHYLAFILGFAYVLVFIIACFYENARAKAERLWSEYVRRHDGSPVLRGMNLFKSAKCFGYIDPREESRSHDVFKMCFETLRIVLYGYPLRFCAGLLAFDPYLFGLVSGGISEFPYRVGMLLLLIVACALYGCAFVYITWSYEASAAKRASAMSLLQLKKDANGVILPSITQARVVEFKKPHIAYLGYRLGSRACCLYPLRVQWSLIEPWNWTALLAILLLHLFSIWLLPCYYSFFSLGLSFVLFTLADCVPNKGVLNIVFTVSIVLIIVECVALVVSLVCSDFYLSVIEFLMRNYLPYGFIETAQDGSLFVGEWFAQLCLRPLIWISQSPYNALAMSVAVVIAQTFLAIYALFRNMNYYDMNAPFLENFINAVKGAALKLSTAILGEHAIDVLCKKKGE